MKLLIILIISLSALSEGSSNLKGKHYNVKNRDDVSPIEVSEYAKSFLVDCPNDSIKDQKKITCNPKYRYRSITGLCNNLEHIWYGAADTPFDRVLLPQYDDGYNSPRRFSADPGYDLPNPRLISQTESTQQTTADVSELFIFFGQFSAHDHVLTPTIEDLNCNNCSTQNPMCFNFYIDDGDRFMNSRDCMPFRRNLDQSTVFDCPSKFRNQFNANTHFMDAGNVYGSTEEENEKVRLFKDGLLKFSEIPGSSIEALPIVDKSQCPMRNGCFVAGDERAEENSLLTVVHTIFVRYHNLLARQYKEIFPSANDETIYQEVRRIVNAVYVNIYLSEFTSLVLGEHLQNFYNLSPLKRGYFYGYDSSVLPHSSIEYQSASGRLHSILHEFVDQADEKLVQLSKTHLTDEIFNTRQAFFNFDKIAFGLLTGSSNSPKPSQFSMSMNNRLFENFVFQDRTDSNSGLNTTSVVALNIQRARDHGIPGYNMYRKKFGLKYAESFDDFSDAISKPNIEKMKKIYSNVNDVDLFYGANAENHLDGGLVGNTNAHIFAQTIHNLKFGDRFYFENGDNENIRFTLAQLDSIRHVRMSSVVCDVLGLRQIQKNAFQLVNNDDTKFRINPLIDCDQLQKIDLNLFLNPDDYQYHRNN